jgi:iron(III) transport system ATP-binding protein
MSAATLELTAVRKSFGTVAAVDEVDMTLTDHDVLALVGPSGCGKSTLLRLVGGLLGLDAGQIRIAGQLVDDGTRRVDPEDRHVGLVFQEHALFPHLTVSGNVAFGLRSLTRADRNRRRDHWLAVVGLSGHGDRYPHELSGGERQRIALARALAPEPSLMLLDEPFASLDPNLRAQIRTDVVDILRSTGTPAVFVTHDQVEALAIGDRVAVMRAGRIEQYGTPEDVFHRPCNLFVAGFMGEASFLPIDTSDGDTELGPLTCHHPIPSGAVLVVRPDDVMADADPTAAGVEATVVAAEFRGPTWCYTLRLPRGTLVRSTQPHTTRIDVGTRVRASIVPGHHTVVPAADGLDAEV